MIGNINLSHTPTPGALLGTRGSAELINNINNSSGKTDFFGSTADPFRTGYKIFMEQVVQPIRIIGLQLEQTVNKLINDDYIRPITSIDELSKGIPPSMYEAIALYEPIRKLALQGRIDCFGLSSDYLKDKEDHWERLLNNGTVDLIDENYIEIDGKKYVTHHYEWDLNTDPKYTVEDLEAIESTRKFCSEFLNDNETKKLDFTNYPNIKG